MVVTLAIAWAINAYNFMDGIDGILGIQCLVAGAAWASTGVIFGSSALIILGTAIGQGSKQQILQFIQALGSNSITIFPGQQRRGAVMGGMGSMQTPTLEDAEAVRKWRQETGGSIKAAAERFGVSIATVKRYCAG